MTNRLGHIQKKIFMRGMFRTAHHFSHNDLKFVMSAFSIEQNVTKRCGNSKLLSSQYGMSNMTEAFFVDVSIDFKTFKGS